MILKIPKETFLRITRYQNTFFTSANSQRMANCPSSIFNASPKHHLPLITTNKHPLKFKHWILTPPPLTYHFLFLTFPPKHQLSHIASSAPTPPPPKFLILLLTFLTKMPSPPKNHFHPNTISLKYHFLSLFLLTQASTPPKYKFHQYTISPHNTTSFHLAFPPSQDTNSTQIGRYHLPQNTTNSQWRANSQDTIPHPPKCDFRPNTTSPKIPLIPDGRPIMRVLSWLLLDLETQIISSP